MSVSGDKSGPPELPGRHRSKRWRAVLIVLAALLIWDVSRPPDRQLSAWLLLGGIGVYQATLSPVMPHLGVTCRFEPSCSRYAEASIRSHGAAKGSWRTLTRLARCGPWTPAGTHDPP